MEKSRIILLGAAVVFLFGAKAEETRLEYGDMKKIKMDKSRLQITVVSEWGVTLRLVEKCTLVNDSSLEIIVLKDKTHLWNGTQSTFETLSAKKSIAVNARGTWPESCEAIWFIANADDDLNVIFIITRAAFALLFLLVPSLIVFTLLYKRQLSLHRARLLQDRAARRRFSISVISEVRVTDVPPTYDDIYETKEPPPCFCQAVTLAVAPPPKIENFSCTSSK